MVKRTTKAETFKYAYTIFVREIWPNIPEQKHIASLLLATDLNVMFDFKEDSEEVIAIFSDGSKAIIYPETLQ
jgi:hypothetical protein